MKKDFAYVIAFMFLALLMISCSSSSEKASQTGGGNQNPAVTTDIASMTAYDIDGNTRSFGEFVGKKALIVNFWGTWCPPCKREMPDLKRIYDEYRDRGLEIIGLVVRSTPQQVKDYTTKNGFDWVMFMAEAKHAQALELGSGVPYTLFIDRDGNVLDETFTGMRGYEDFKRMVEQII